MNGIETAFVARVGSEPELKTSQTGTSWTSLSACVGDDKDAQWVKIVAFGEQAQQLAGSLKKGDRVYVEGRLRQENWTGKDGKERTGIKVAAWKIERLGQIGRNKPKVQDGERREHDGGQRHQDPQSDYRQSAAARPSGKAGFDTKIDEEIPFAPEWR